MYMHRITSFLPVLTFITSPNAASTTGGAEGGLVSATSLLVNDSWNGSASTTGSSYSASCIKCLSLPSPSRETSTISPCTGEKTVSSSELGRLELSIQKPKSGISDAAATDDAPNSRREHQAAAFGLGEFDGIKVDVLSCVGSNVTLPIDNDLFHGKLCVLMRDHPNCNYNFDGEDNVFYEVQVQGKFKRIPKGPLYMAVELPQVEEYKVSLATKAILKACIAFIRSFGYRIHLSFGGKGDLPHLSSPAFQAFDRIVITKPGAKPPKLGEPIPETYEDTRKRKQFHLNHSIDTCHTYTLSFNHTYFNPVEWRAYGIPLIKSFDLTPLTDVMRLSLYEVVHEDGKEQSNFHGDVQAVARGRHTKRITAMWIQLRKLGV